MKCVAVVLLALLAVTGVQSARAAESAATYARPVAAPIDPDTGLRINPAFRVTVFHPGVGAARHIAVRDDGAVYVQRRDGSGIVALADRDGDGVADQRAVFAAPGGTGIAVRDGWLYYSSDSAVFRAPFVRGRLLPDRGRVETVVSGFPRTWQHAAKAFTFDRVGNLYVEMGAPSNACQRETRTPGSPGQRPCPLLAWSAGVWRFGADRPGQSFQQDGTRFVTGLRHAVALDWNPVTDALYLVQHGRDQLSGLWPRHFSVQDNAELPAEEFHRVSEGDDLGWPYSYYNPERRARMLAPEYGGDGETPSSQGKQPLIGFPAHWAPNDLLFYTGSQFPSVFHGGAFIAFHGSWNRAPLAQGGYNVVFVPFRDGVPLSDRWIVFADGFAGTFDIVSPSHARFRPMGLAQGLDGALFIVDSQQGRLWRVTYGDG